MARSMTGPMSAELVKKVVRPVLLCQMEFDSGDFNVWSGIGPLPFDGDTYTGLGNFGGVSPIEETIDTKAVGLSYSLSGVPSAVVAIALTENYQERSARLFFGMLDDNGALIADPFKLHEGRMDVMILRDDGKTADIELKVESRLIDLERPKVRRYTSEDQKAEFPNDTGFDFVASLQDKQIVWGRSSQ